MTPEELAEIHTASFLDARHWSAEEFADLLKAKNIFICTVENGFCMGRIAATEAELLTIAVNPDSRKQGLGRELVHAFEAQAKSRGAEQIFLEVEEGNEAAIELYLSQGYAQKGYRKNYYKLSDNQQSGALVMIKSLG